MEHGRVSDHVPRVVRVLIETFGIALALGVVTWYALGAGAPWWAVAVPVVAQGFWLQRFYVVGHFAAHKTLLPAHPGWNDAVGQAALFALLVPLRIFRKIHAFHHGANRRDVHTSALDTYVVPRGAGPLRRLWCRVQWYAAVFAGGWFVHSLVSILLFLFLPLRVARRVSPAFRGWRRSDQLASIGVFAVAVALHASAWRTLGAAWLVLYVAPLGVFAWVYSAQLYIYHHDTTIGPEVRFHARSLRSSPVVSWWLLNLNEHATHHRDPRVVWYALPAHREDPPPEFASNRDVVGFWRAVVDQLRGPRIVEDP